MSALSYEHYKDCFPSASRAERSLWKTLHSSEVFCTTSQQTLFLNLMPLLPISRSLTHDLSRRSFIQVGFSKLYPVHSSFQAIAVLGNHSSFLLLSHLGDSKAINIFCTMLGGSEDAINSLWSPAFLQKIDYNCGPHSSVVDVFDRWQPELMLAHTHVCFSTVWKRHEILCHFTTMGLS